MLTVSMLAIVHGMIWLLMAAAIVMFVVAAVSIFHGVLSYKRSLKQFTARDLPIKTWIVCVIVWALTFGGIEVFEGLLRAQVRHVLLHAGSPVSVVAEGIQLKDPAPLVAAIRDIRRPSPHHSHPTRCSAVTLQWSASVLDLVLCQDSQEKTEYWVFYPVYRFSSMNEIGRILIAQPLRLHTESSNKPMHLTVVGGAAST